MPPTRSLVEREQRERIISQSVTRPWSPDKSLYKPLRDMEFRLIKIPSKTSEQPVRCEILYADLNSPPQYTAISYTWGDASDTCTIVLNTFSFSVGVNLHGALCAVGKTTSDVLVWVDALCIDQHNTNEKTIQIPLMGQIYSRADFVSVWLGPEDDNSDAVIKLLRRLHRISEEANHHDEISSLLSSQSEKSDVAAVVSLFEREYWSYSQVLASQGPSSLSDIEYLDEGSLLDVLRACRNKIASKPQDKLFGILGILPPKTRDQFRPDDSRSVKDVYIEIVDYLVTTTGSLDVMCDAIHFPAHTSSENLPSYVPDWSHIPSVVAMGNMYKISASGNRKSQHKFDERMSKIEFDAIYIDTIGIHGIAVGTLCTSADYLMAFVHWKALLLGAIQNESKEVQLSAQEEFCNVLSLGQIPAEFESPADWLAFCYHVFASLLRERLPCLQLNDELLGYSEMTTDPSKRRESLQSHFGSKMMGRCFFRTEEGMIGMGSGAVIPGDIIVVPLGCSTPVLLREEGTRGEYRFVGDVYLINYMHGQAIDEAMQGENGALTYVLH
ncbi:hypothetical protein HYALB_00011308 [Hymenoscyphus albidus]|uniref:Heterokaryon incompatibility domain-containing protein n=1 Tax=Hymenoscyphus albidus TaxID=595503 RepID=A0A9N9LJA6_9HELO|nr:hypothetical protein HYALB_00011308 [Hymenoscyphus albidus]